MLARWTILSVTTLSGFMVAVDANIVAIGLPKISAELSSGVSLLSWVITAYVIAIAMFLLQAGKLGDVFGKKRIYLIGFAIFGGASAFCGISQNITELVGFRFVQGLGGAMLAACQFPLIFEAFPPSERGIAVGTNSIAWAVGSVAGPVLGGFIVSIDWRLIFYINVPIAIIAVLIGKQKIPSIQKLGEGNGTLLAGLSSINLLDSVLLALTVAMLLIWLTFFQWIYGAVSVCAFLALAFSEFRSKNPLLNKDLRRVKGFIYLVVSMSIIQLAAQGIPFVLSIYFQTVREFPPLWAGVWIAPLPLAQAIVNPIAGRSFDRLKVPARVSILGALAAGVALLILSGKLLDAGSDPFEIILLLTLMGVGLAFIWTPTISAILKFAKPELRGVATGTALTMVNISFGASVAVIVYVMATVIPRSMASQVFFGGLSNLTSSQIVVLSEGLSRALVVLGVICFVAVISFFVASREQTKPSFSSVEKEGSKVVENPP